MSKEIPSQKDVLEKRTEELSKKAEQESKTPDYSAQYARMTGRLREEIPKSVEGTMTKLMELYVDNMRQNGSSSKGYGAKVYSAVNDYLKNEVFGLPEPTKEMGKEMLDDLLQNYHGLDIEGLDELFNEESTVKVMNYTKFMEDTAQTLNQSLGSGIVKSVQKAAAKDVEGFRKYVTELANAEKVSFEKDETQSLEALTKLYLTAVAAPEKEKQIQRFRKRR